MDSPDIDPAVYNQHLTVINNIQLKFEQFMLTAPLIRDERVDKQELRRSFARIEVYLREIVSEYESERRVAVHTSGDTSISSMPKLYEFLDADSLDPFIRNVVAPVQIILSALQEALLEPLELPALSVDELGS